MSMKDILFELSAAVTAGYVSEASEVAAKHLSRYMQCERYGNTVIGFMPGEGDYTLMLDAHIDEIAFTVTDVDDNGFLTVAKCGGFDLRGLPATPVTVHGKYEVPAVFCSIPPHLASGDMEYDDISKFKIDSLLGENAKDVISLGDIVTFRSTPVELAGNRVCGKSFDDRAAVVCLIEVARRISERDLPFNVAFVLSDQEELGCRGSKTATFTVDPQEAIALDVSFGDSPEVSPYECGKLSEGAMIGFSPFLDSNISHRLVEIAQDNDIKYQLEAMGGRTGTNGDVISVSKGGVRTGLLSIPLRNMHTSVEVLDLNDLTSVCDILEEYIISGGVKNV